MNKDSETENLKKASNFSIEVGKKEKQKIKARKNPAGVWFGLGMMGLIGWSVTLPTLIGALVGAWLDKSYPSGRSWTLALLIAGLCVGCLSALHWLGKQHNEMQEEQENNDE